jgi:hypothetical protein
MLKLFSGRMDLRSRHLDCGGYKDVIKISRSCWEARGRDGDLAVLCGFAVVGGSECEEQIN